jgi:hypothetical protein
MPDVTPIYNWPIPEDTDLVKDGAEAIRDLAGAIETTVDSGGDSGLVHIETRAMSAVAAESFNDVFSATYTNYVIALNFTNGLTSDVLLRLRVGGVDNSTSGNYRWNISTNTSSATTTTVSNSGTGESAFRVGASSANSASVLIQLFDPFTSIRTTFNSQNAFIDGSSNSFTRVCGGVMTVTTSFDGFTILNTGGVNMNGSVSVFGYRKS